MKQKAAFISSNSENRILDAFDPLTRQALSETLEFPEEVILPSQFEQYRGYLAQTEYLFSTWGMPELSEEEIRT